MESDLQVQQHLLIHGAIIYEHRHKYEDSHIPAHRSTTNIEGSSPPNTLLSPTLEDHGSHYQQHANFYSHTLPSYKGHHPSIHQLVPSNKSRLKQLLNRIERPNQSSKTCAHTSHPPPINQATNSTQLSTFS